MSNAVTRSIAASATVLALLASGIITASPATATPAGMPAPTHITMGTASTYAILAGTSLTTGAGVSLSGTAGVDIGLSVEPALITSAGTALQGARSVNVVNTESSQAGVDLKTVYDNLMSRLATPIPSELGALTYGPGVYASADYRAINGNITLDAGGDANAKFIFRTDGTINTVEAIVVKLTNGAQAANVYWVAGSAVTLGAHNVFAGNIISGTSAAAISVGANSVITGSLLGLAGVPVTVGEGVTINHAAAVYLCVNLGTAASHFVIAGPAFTTGDKAVIGGTAGTDITMSPGIAPSFTGTAGTLPGVGAINVQSPTAVQAQADASAARDYLWSLTPKFIDGALGGQTITPGVWTPGANGAPNNAAFTAIFATKITFDAQGDPNAEFVMQTQGSLTTFASVEMVLVNGAQAGNVYWVSKGEFRTGAATIFVGNAFTLGSNILFDDPAYPSGRKVIHAGMTTGAETIIYGALYGGVDSQVTTGEHTQFVHDTSTQAYSCARTPYSYWTDSSIRAISLDLPYTDTISGKTSDDTGVISYAVTEGSLPAGISLSSATGELTGTATVAGTYPFTVSVIAAGHSPAKRNFYLKVAKPETQWLESALHAPQAAVSYTDSVTAKSSDASILVTLANVDYAVTAGSLPSGLSLDSTTGVVTGRPTLAGNYSFTVSAVIDGHTPAVTMSYSMTVAPASAVVVSPPVVPSFSVVATDVGAQAVQAVAVTFPGDVLPPVLTVPNIATARVIYRMTKSGTWQVVPRLRQAAKHIPLNALFTPVRSPIAGQSKNIPAAVAQALRLSKSFHGRTNRVIAGLLWRHNARIIVNW